MCCYKEPLRRFCDAAHGHPGQDSERDARTMGIGHLLRRRLACIRSRSSAFLGHRTIKTPPIVGVAVHDFGIAREHETGKWRIRLVELAHIQRSNGLLLSEGVNVHPRCPDKNSERHGPLRALIDTGASCSWISPAVGKLLDPHSSGRAFSSLHPGSLALLLPYHAPSLLSSVGPGKMRSHSSHIAHRCTLYI